MKKLAIIAAIGLVIFFCVGIFTIQPIGAIPDGVTVVYFRLGTKLPFISSPDGLLLKSGQGVSLLGRAMAMGAMSKVVIDRKILRLPYMHVLYLLSTGGKEIDFSDAKNAS